LGGYIKINIEGIVIIGGLNRRLFCQQPITNCIDTEFEQTTALANKFQ